MSVSGQVTERKDQRPKFEKTVPRLAPRMELGDVISLYKSVGRRNMEYFHWLYKIYSWICLPCVSPELKEMLTEDKTKMMVFDILLDDLADNHTTRSEVLLEEFIGIPWNIVGGQQGYLDVGRRIWEDYITSVRTYPRFKDLERVFYFDLRQALASMDYSFLVNSVGLDNPVELNVYAPNGCMVMIAIDMDLMCSPQFDIDELGKMRGIAYYAQKVTHIGNMLSTYRDEVMERDLSCPIISLAVKTGSVSKDELGKAEVVPKIAKLEWVFRRRANSYIQKVSMLEKEVKSVNLRGFSEYLTELFRRFESSGSLR